MLIEANGFIVITIKQTLTMQPSLIDQACDNPEPLTRTPREDPRRLARLRSGRQTKRMRGQLTQFSFELCR